ncbi:MAG: oxygen-binding di-iron domain-containing protein [Candidatus Aquicultor sp.]
MSQNKEEIYWVGTYIPASGLSINSYLILDEYPTLINAGAPISAGQLIKKIQSVVDLHDIQYIVLNQAGVSYAGGLQYLLELAPQARVVTSKYESIRLGLYGLMIQPLIIEDGDMLQIGHNTLRFFSAPFIGSPDAVFVFDESNGILFSGEAFSTTVSKWRMVIDEDITELLEAYSDVHIGDSTLAGDAIERLKGLDIQLIAPGHGPLLKNYASKYIEALAKRHGAAA